jgi:amino acid adenylation domain-containing protein
VTLNQAPEAGEAELSAAKRAILQARLQGRGRRAPALLPGHRTEAPLTFAQERFWFMERAGQGGSAYNIPAGLWLPPGLDEAAMQRALAEVVRRHDVLRTTFRERGDGDPVQVVAPFTGFSLPVVDLSALGADERAARVRDVANQEAAHPFQLETEPLLRARLLRLGGEGHVLLLCTHHIISDGWSLRVLFRELWTLYDAFCDGRDSPLPPLPVQFADFAAWQREQVDEHAQAAHFAYWKERLAGAPELLKLAADHPRPARPSFRGGAVPVRVAPGLVERFQVLAQEEGATLYMVVLAAFTVLLSRYGSTEDVVVGSPVAGRRRKEVEDVIGFFANTLVLRTDLSGEPTFRALVGRVRETVLGAYEHQEVQLDRVIAELRAERSQSHMPLLQVVFQLDTVEGLASGEPALRGRPVEFDYDDTRLDLALGLATHEGRLGGQMEYSTGLFERDTVLRMVQHLGRVLQQVAADPDRGIAGLDLLGEDERRRVIHEWNPAPAGYPDRRPVHLRVQAWADAAPEAPAVTCGGRTLSYRELDERACRLANRLVRLGVGPEVPVVVCLERGPELVVCLLSVLMAGGAYVPLDPTHPAERLRAMAADCGARVLLTREALRDAVPPPQGVHTILVDAEWGEIAGESAERPRRAVADENLAYLVYTSGSTGTPKGVAVHHGGLRNLCAWYAGAFALTPADRVSQLASPGFDALAFELWPCLTHGACLQIVPDEVRTGAGELRDWLVRQGTTAAWVPTPLAEPLLKLEWPDDTVLRWLHAAGDRLQGRPVAGAPFTVTNSYGPTECTVAATSGRVESGGARPPTIGTPIANTRVYVLDGRMRPLPAGIPGELFLGGVQVARGYAGRPGLTAERFLPDAFGAPGTRVYRTGDQVRWLRDGTLEFIGRLDEQVKIRGLRIELGEIEAVLRSRGDVAEAAVVVREDRPGGRRLVAYVAGSAPEDTLRDHLRKALPDYMVPGVFVFLPSLPVTPNGKVDRRALPAPEVRVPAPGAAEPRNFVEVQLIQIWEELLGVEGVGPTQSFFELGGSSLLALPLFARINGSLHCDLPVSTLFAAATVRQLADVIIQQQSAAPASASPVVPMQPHGSLPPLFCVHPADRRVVGYLNLVRRLGPDQPAFGLQDVGEDLSRPLSRIAAEHVDAVRSVQPEGPYYLAGWSFGGYVAHEMACQLEAAGHAVAFLGLLDAISPAFEHDWRPPGDLDLLLGLAGDVAAQTRRPFSIARHELVGLDPGEQLRRVAAALQAQEAAPAHFDAAALGAQCRVMRDRAASLAGYVPGRFSGPLTLFRAEEQPDTDPRLLAPFTQEERRTLGWSRFSPVPVTVHWVAGSHVTMGAEPQVAVLAQRIRDSLARAREEAGGGDGTVHLGAGTRVFPDGALAPADGVIPDAGAARGAASAGAAEP